MQVESFYLSAFCQSLDKSIVARTEESDSKNKKKSHLRIRLWGNWLPRYLTNHWKHPFSQVKQQNNRDLSPRCFCGKNSRLYPMLIKKNFLGDSACKHWRAPEPPCCYGNRQRRSLNVKKNKITPPLPPPPPLGNYPTFAPHSSAATQATVSCNLV